MSSTPHRNEENKIMVKKMIQMAVVQVIKQTKRGFEMKKIIALVLVGMFVLCSSKSVLAATKAEAEALVKKSIAFVKESGKEKGFAEISNLKGKFVKGELYVVVLDKTGKCLAHGSNNKLIGKDLSSLKDPDGKAFVKELIDVASSKGKGWVEYKVTNPATDKVQQKIAYVELSDGMSFLAGIFK
jgi:hypothetical protein